MGVARDVRTFCMLALMGSFTTCNVGLWFMSMKGLEIVISCIILRVHLARYSDWGSKYGGQGG